MDSLLTLIRVAGWSLSSARNDDWNRAEAVTRARAVQYALRRVAGLRLDAERPQQIGLLLLRQTHTRNFDMSVAADALGQRRDLFDRAGVRGFQLCAQLAHRCRIVC